MRVCADDQHDLDNYFNLGPGVVYNGCTKCSYWEPVDISKQHGMEITITSIDGSTETFIS